MGQRVLAERGGRGGWRGIGRECGEGRGRLGAGGEELFSVRRECFAEGHVPGLMPFSGRKAVCTRGGSHTGTGERASKPSSGSCPANHAVAAPGCIPVRTAVSVPTVGPIRPRRGPSGAGGGEGDLEALAGGLGGGACLVLEGGAAERDGPRGGRPERGRVGIRGVLRE